MDSPEQNSDIKNVEKSPTPTIDQEPEITPGLQAATVIIATAVSFGFGFITQIIFIPEAPLESKWLLWLPVIIGSITAVGFGLKPGRQALRHFIEAFNKEPTPGFNRFSETVKIWTLFIVSILCIILLGYFTTFTGGTVASPYSQSLLAMALLSPQIAKTKNAVLLITLVVFIVYIAFADWEGAYRGPAVPQWLSILATIVAAVVALFSPLWGRTRQEPLYWSHPRGLFYTKK